jgi:hypothetical protein
MSRNLQKTNTVRSIVGLPRGGGVAGCDDDGRRRRMRMRRRRMARLG